MVAKKTTKKTKLDKELKVSTRAFVLIFTASFAIGFITSLMLWLAAIDYIFIIFN